MESKGGEKRMPFNALRGAVISLGAVFCFTTLILLAAGATPLDAYYHLFMGSLGTPSKWSHVLVAWIPLTLCAVGLLYTFRIGLWNIGIEGQVIMGGIAATAVLRYGVESSMPGLFLLFSLPAGMAGGALWALISGLLKTKGGVHEIFAGLGLNFISQGMLLWLIFGPWKRPGVASMSGTELFPETLRLPLLTTFRFSPAGIFLVILGIFLTAWMIRYSRIGLALKAIGHNPQASFLFGLKPQRFMLLATLLAGGFAGAAGYFQVTGVYHRLIPAISSNYGYLGLLVVMLSNFNIWTVPGVAFFFACLNVGSIQLPMMLRIDSSLSGIIQGALVLTTLTVYAWRRRKKNAGSDVAE
jgi:simple sugar transport system permease protein